MRLVLKPRAACGIERRQAGRGKIFRACQQHHLIGEILLEQSRGEMRAAFAEDARQPALGERRQSCGKIDAAIAPAATRIISTPQSISRAAASRGAVSFAMKKRRMRARRRRQGAMWAKA